MSQSYSIRLIKKTDFSQAVTLTNLMNWGFDVEDFSYMLKIEEKGCFVAVRDNNVIGLITSISFRHMGWIGNIIVEPNERMKGIGAALVTEALNYLKARGVKTVGLYAYKKVVPFYEKFGFRFNRDYSWLVCRNARWTDGSFPRLSHINLPAVLEFDEKCFGASRKRLIETIYKSPQAVCGAVMRGNKPVTYLMAVKSSGSVEIGPWVCEPDEDDEGFNLFKSLGNELHGLETHVGVPSDRAELLSFLLKLGFTQDFPVVRMYLVGSP